MPPGAAGEDDEDDEDQPLGPKPGQEEGPAKDGKEMPLSPEQAGWLLDTYRLDSERRLPMGQGPTARAQRPFPSHVVILKPHAPAVPNAQPSAFGPSELRAAHLD